MQGRSAVNGVSSSLPAGLERNATLALISGIIRLVLINKTHLHHDRSFAPVGRRDNQC